MPRKKYHTGFILILSALATNFHTELEAAQPNVLLIVTDDQGIGDFGFMNPLVKTPNIDLLARQSALYTNFVACPASSPSRASLYTGRNHLMTGVWGVPPRANLKSDETLMPRFFKAEGYSTLLLGKRDCTQPVGCEPWEAGWDGGWTVTGYQQKDPVMGTKNGLIKRDGYTSEIMADEAVKFIDLQKGSPWFISLNFITPHMPWVCSSEFSAPYIQAGCSENLARCWGAITQMDAALGRVLQAIEKNGLENNTIVLLYSDNGPTSPEVQKLVGKREQDVPGVDWKMRNSLHLRAYKSSTYQNGVRVPFMVKYPNVVEPGQRTQFVRIEDVLPTLLKLTGLDFSRINHLPFDGVSITDNLKGKNKPVVVPDAFRINIAHEGGPRTKGGIIEHPAELKMEDHHIMLQNERFVYHNLPHQDCALYDLTIDPGEKNNIASQYSEITKKMADECQKQWDKILRSGRAFNMPALKIGRLLWNGKPETLNIFPAVFMQSKSGDIAISGQYIVGFDTKNGKAQYRLDVVTPGKYSICVQGRNLNECSSPILKIGNKIMTGKINNESEIIFGDCDLTKDDHEAQLSITDRTKESPAMIRHLIFSTPESVEHISAENIPSKKRRK